MEETEVELSLRKEFDGLGLKAGRTMKLLKVLGWKCGGHV